MLKILYDKGYLNIEKILVKEYKNLNLEITELAILLLLFNNEKEYFSSLFLAEKTNFSKNEIENILESLMKKNFFIIKQQKKNDKLMEILNLDNTFFQLEEFLFQKKKITKEKNENFIKETIEELEQLKGNILTNFELEIVKNWYLEKKYSHKDIQESIQKSFLFNKKSLNYIETILNQKKKSKDELLEKDFQSDEMLYKIFKKIK
ncbi:DnaD domain protein [Candidatus Phytoplasma oryzae]|nr:DnaD domain protein [Candidatus Phytoplasma oryzae]